MPSAQAPSIETTCCIIGGGPAGIMLGYLLARSGVPVTVLEKHKDFNRDFRGDTIHPSTLQLLHELGLLDRFLQVPHSKVTGLSALIGGQRFQMSDFSHLPTVRKIHRPHAPVGLPQLPRPGSFRLPHLHPPHGLGSHRHLLRQQQPHHRRPRQHPPRPRRNPRRPHRRLRRPPRHLSRSCPPQRHRAGRPHRRSLVLVSPASPPTPRTPSATSTTATSSSSSTATLTFSAASLSPRASTPNSSSAASKPSATPSNS